MANFYFERYVNNYEIDFYNHGTNEEKLFLKQNNIEIGCYYKSGVEWCKRMSGMTFNIKHLDNYNKLKEYLDYRFNQFIRKQKLERINEI